MYKYTRILLYLQRNFRTQKCNEIRDMHGNQDMD